MANKKYKLSNSDYWETSGVYDITEGKTQREVNAALKGSLGECFNNVNNLPLISDCNSSQYTIGMCDVNTLHTPATEGITQAAEGIIVSLKRNSPTWNVQYIFLNGGTVNQYVFVRYVRDVANNWTAWGVLNDSTSSWYGKKALIIGDSYAKGWNGAEYVTPWTTATINQLGITADIFANRGAGFTIGGNSESDYPNENYVDLLNRTNKNNDYDLIIVAGALNDILRGNSSLIGPNMTAFMDACRQYYPKAKVYYIPLAYAYFIPLNRRNYSNLLFNNARINNYIVSYNSVRWMTGRTQYMQSDTDGEHYNAEGYKAIGNYIAAFVNGVEYPQSKTDIVWPFNTLSNAMGTLAANNSIISNMSISYMIQGDIASLQGYITFNSTPTDGNIITGIYKALSGQFESLVASWDSAITSFTPVPRVRVSETTDALQINGVTSAMANKRLYISGHYHIALNYNV